jgi:hypothetical protein
MLSSVKMLLPNGEVDVLGHNCSRWLALVAFCI